MYGKSDCDFPILAILRLVEVCWPNSDVSEISTGEGIASHDLLLHLSLGSFSWLAPAPEQPLICLPEGS